MTPYYNQDGITIYHGDCLQILERLPAGFVDVVITDPPYGIGTGKRGDWILGDYAGQFSHAVTVVMPLLYRITKADGALYGFTSWRHMAAWIQRCNDYFKMQQFIVWDKGRHSGLWSQYSWQFHWEGIYYGLKGPRLIREYFADVQRVAHKPIHPMAKPVELCERLVRASSDQGDIILDPFMGSGASLIAAKQTGRRAIGIEIEERYCEMAVQRLAQGVLALDALSVREAE